MVKLTRRDRFVLALAFSFGMADMLIPDIFTHLFDGVDNPSPGLQGLFDSIIIILSTPCKFGIDLDSRELFCGHSYVLSPLVLAAGVVASVVNLLLPAETESEELSQEDGSDSGRSTEEKHKVVEV